MTAAAAILFLVSVWLAVWSYVLYPPWIRRLARRRTPGPLPEARPPGPAPSVEVLVSAADEERVIGARVRDLRAQTYPGPYAIAVGCDGCADATAHAARQALDGAGAPGRVVEYPQRRGKAAVLDDLIASSAADVVVFTDANTRFDPEAVRLLAETFADPGVGAACGRLSLEAADGRPSPETVFWDWETATKEAEGRLGVCLGANGAIYAARRRAVVPLPPGTILDDLLIPARVAAGGAASVFAAGAVARETLPSRLRDEMSRRFRIGIGAGRVLRRERWLWSFGRRPLLALVFFSRKAARWLAPVAALLAAVSALGSRALAPYAAGALAAAATLALSALGSGAPGRRGRLYYFAVINLALSAGVLAGVLGYRRPAWKPVSPRT
ncbi:MAG TPA: glycosyltransferase [Thermoanaerobaculia bacterium]|jgi:cellulose synthase/poly-beta-1,6-N-acetylglucosamine synthase-like glycosyltransferase